MWRWPMMKSVSWILRNGSLLNISQVFAGPMSESVPTSVTSFAHRRSRADSTASFTYLQDEDDVTPQSDEQVFLEDEEDDDYEEDSVDLEAGEGEPMRRVSSGYSRSSAHDRLLRNNSTRTESSGHFRISRSSQKIYIENEDLTIVVAGFKTSSLGFALYTTICIFTGGIGWLLLRWLPRLQVRLTGSPTSLRDCSWVVVEVRKSAARTRAMLIKIEPMGRICNSQHRSQRIWEVTLHCLWFYWKRLCNIRGRWRWRPYSGGPPNPWLSLYKILISPLERQVSADQ